MAVRLTEEQKIFIVHRLARFETATEVQRVVREHFGIECSRPQIAYYDPTTRHGHALRSSYRKIFEAERERHSQEAPKGLMSRQVVQLERRRAKYRQRLCAGGYLNYLWQTLPRGWSADAPHIRLIAEHLDAVERGEIDRLAIHMPPRHGKTETVSVRYATYCLMRDPARNVLITGYNERFARRLSRKARNVATGRVAIDPKKCATDEWATLSGGVLMARGVGSPPTGAGFNRIIIDDPIRRREDAESEVYREKLWDWYTDDLYTRLEPGGAILLIMTLWHEDDLGARAVASEPGRWTVLKLAALAETHPGTIVPPLPHREGEESKAAPGPHSPAPARNNGGGINLTPQPPSLQVGGGRTSPNPSLLRRGMEEVGDPLGRRPGEALWPERFDREALLRIREVLMREHGERSWLALYQQRPTPREGAFFKVSQVEIAPCAPANMRSVVRAWDLAATAGGGAYTAGVKMGVDKDGVYWVLDVVRGQWSTDERDRVIVQTAALDGKGVKIRGPQDPGAAGKGAAEAFVRMLAGYSVVVKPVSGSKELRADPYSSQLNAGNVRLVEGAWNRAFIEEHRLFPRGSAMDQVDAASDAFAELSATPAGWATDEECLRKMREYMMGPAVGPFGPWT